MSAAEGQVVSLTLSTSKLLRNDTNFDRLWQRICSSLEQLDVEKPCCSKAPCRLGDGSAPTFHGTVEEHYRVVYFEALDLITSCIIDRFDQPGYN